MERGRPVRSHPTDAPSVPRRADWRGRETGPGHVAEFLRSVRRESLRSPWAATPGFVALYFGPPVALGVVMGATLGPCVGFLAVLLGLGLYPKLIQPWVERSRRRPLGALADVLPLPLPPGTFPVIVTIRHGSSVTGLDEALATFVDGWLVVEGGRASFSLRVVDGRAEWDRGTLRIALPEFQTVTLDLVEDRGLDVYHAQVANAARRWIDARERPEGEPVLPPLATLPLLHRGWNGLGIGGFLLVVAMEAIRYGAGFGSFGLLATALACLGVLAFGRSLFMIRGQEAADRRARALSKAAPEMERGRPIRDDALR